MSWQILKMHPSPIQNAVTLTNDDPAATATTDYHAADALARKTLGAASLAGVLMPQQAAHSRAAREHDRQALTARTRRESASHRRLAREHRLAALLAAYRIGSTP